MDRRIKGIALSLAAGSFWGVMGVASQYLIEQYHFTPWQMVTPRMLVAGFILFLITLFRNSSMAFAPWKRWIDLRDTMIFGIVIVLCQITYFLCIQKANAPTAAVLAATCPLWIMFIMGFFQHTKIPAKVILLSLVALFGVVLMVSQGSLKNLMLSWYGTFFGLFSAASMAVYTLQPQKVFKRIGIGPATSWAMMFTGIFSIPFAPFWDMQNVHWCFTSAFFYFVVVVGCAILAYLCYMNSSKLIPPDITGLMETVEPITSVILSIIFLGLALNLWEIVGGLLILFAVVELSRKPHHKPSSKIK